MTPELRALADRFIYEQATVKHILNLAPERQVSGAAYLDSTELETQFAHLAFALHGFAETLAAWRRGEHHISLGWKPCDLAPRAMLAKHLRPTTLAKSTLAEALGKGLNTLVATLALIPDEALEEPLGPGEAIEAVRLMAEHCLSHAIPLVDALPEVRFDPLVLNWLLSAEFEDEASVAWQAKLYADAEEYVASQPDEEEDDE